MTAKTETEKERLLELVRVLHPAGPSPAGLDDVTSILERYFTWWCWDRCLQGAGVGG